MEKITLKSQAKELVFRIEEPGVYFDVLSCTGTTTQEKNLGSLFMVNQIKFTDEDLAYLISLASSLAKREYYSEQSLAEQDAKSAFNRTLRKLNEVLDEFFQNKKFHLNMGLVSISGNSVYISKLGKFKVSLARNGQLIDVLNNIEFFDRDMEGEKQFSNIISGKLQPGDKIFAYYPLRSTVSREKQLNNMLIEANQEEFDQKLAQFAASAKNFSCCGIHIQMQQVKELPIQTKSHYSIRTASVPQGIPASTPTTKETSSANQTRISSDAILNKNEQEESGPENNSKRQSTSVETTLIKPYIIPAELSVGRRSNPLSTMASYMSKLKNLGQFNSRIRARVFLSIAAVVLIPLLVFVGIRTFGTPSELKQALNYSRENLRLAQSNLSQNKTKEARLLLYQALATISAINKNKTTEAVRSEINQTLSVVDKTSDQMPIQFADLNQDGPEQPAKTNYVSPFADGAIVLTDVGSIVAISQNGATEIARLSFPAKYIFGSAEYLTAHDGQQFWFFDIKNQKTALYTLKEPPQIVDATIYENNLYMLATDSVYKYSDVVTGGVSGSTWAQSISNGTAIAADGKIYILTSAGHLEIYFKGAKTGEFDLQLSHTSGSRIFTFKDHAFLYITDKTNARVYVFDKATGSLKVSYDLSLVGAITDISVSRDGSVWVLSSVNKIWTIK